MTQLLTVVEVAERLRLSAYFVKDELKRKNLRGSKIGREWRVSEDDLDTYINAKANVSRSRRSA